MESDGIKGTRMTLHKGLYDRLIYEDEVGEVATLTGQQRALVTTPTAHQRREQFIAELVQRLPELLDAAAADQPDSSEKAKAEIELIRQMLIQLRLGGQGERLLAMPAKLLKSVHAPNADVAMPATGLRHPWLFTSARTDPSLLNEFQPMWRRY